MSGLAAESLRQVEADSYWCLTRLLETIQDFYTLAQTGIQRQIQKLRELINRVDGEPLREPAPARSACGTSAAQPDHGARCADRGPLAALARHLEAHNIEYLQFAFRWMNCLLMRELPLRCIVRMWDTYLVCRCRGRGRADARSRAELRPSADTGSSGGGRLCAVPPVCLRGFSREMEQADSAVDGLPGGPASDCSRFAEGLRAAASS